MYWIIVEGGGGGGVVTGGGELDEGVMIGAEMMAVAAGEVPSGQVSGGIT